MTVLAKRTVISSGPATIMTVSGRPGNRHATITVSAAGEEGMVYGAAVHFCLICRVLISLKVRAPIPLIRGPMAIVTKDMRSVTVCAAVSGRICTTTVADRA